MTDISFTFTGPMTIHIHVYPGAEPPVITAPVGADQARYIVSDVSAYPEPPAPDLPSLVPAEPLDAAPPAAPASEPVGGPLSAVIPKSPRAGVRKVCPICGKPISKKAAACHHHRGVVARLLAAGAPRASWPTATPAQPIPAPAPPIPALADPARTAVEELPPPAPVDPPPPISRNPCGSSGRLCPHPSLPAFDLARRD